MAADPRGSDQAAGEPLLDDDLVAELADDLGEAGLETLIGVFSSDLVQRIGALRAALETADLQAARRILHAMAGSSAWIGAVSLAARCRAAMHADALPPAIDAEIESEASAVLAAFTRHRAAA
jgi:HPt (histidine-containing phosphotransfer) domain-containing protein